MFGYIRRKVTYNMGKGGSIPTTAPPVSVGKWFPTEKNQNKKHYEIVDEGGRVMVDKQYVDMGEKEGWLEWQGWSHNMHGEIVYRYRLK